MAKSTLKPTRKLTGGRYKQPTKRLSNLSTNPIFTKIGEKKIKLERTRGGHIKSKLLLIKEINVYNPKTKKTIKTEIKSIIENNANRHFVRRGILNVSFRNPYIYCITIIISCRAGAWRRTYVTSVACCVRKVSTP